MEWPEAWFEDGEVAPVPLFKPIGHFEYQSLFQTKWRKPIN